MRFSIHSFPHYHSLSVWDKEEKINFVTLHARFDVFSAKIVLSACSASKGFLKEHTQHAPNPF